VEEKPESDVDPVKFGRGITGLGWVC
jgi:hypothetical protein